MSDLPTAAPTLDWQATWTIGDTIPADVTAVHDSTGDEWRRELLGDGWVWDCGEHPRCLVRHEDWLLAMYGPVFKYRQVTA